MPKFGLSPAYYVISDNLYYCNLNYPSTKYSDRHKLNGVLIDNDEVLFEWAQASVRTCLVGPIGGAESDELYGYPILIEHQKLVYLITLKQEKIK